MFKRRRVARWFSAVLSITLLLASLTLMVGCEGDSAESIIRQIELIIAGVYEHPTAGSTLVAKNTGQPITRMTIRQEGDRLEAFDNNGQQFFGTVGRASEDSATITLTGPTTEGNEGIITATVTVPVGSTDATMSGTWAEPTLLSAVFGQAIVPVNEGSTSTNGTGSGDSASDVGLASDGSATINITDDDTRVFTVTGGTAPYTVSLSNGGIGSVNVGTVDAEGGTFTYTATGGGEQTITVSDSADGNSDASAILTQNAGP